MPTTHFDAPLFMEEMSQRAVDLGKTPYFWNQAGAPTYCDALPEGFPRLAPASTDPSAAMGNEYVVTSAQQSEPSSFGVQTQLSFAAEEVLFTAFWATRSIAAAFGMTLVEPGQAVEVQSPVALLHHVEYTYGVFAGHRSPYQSTGNRLLSVACTDLEHHDFPHLLLSTDPRQPLVVSVGRYWPQRGIVRLADLWVPRGSALYLPPRPASSGSECIDLHGNRNAAQACWGHIGQDSIVTQTLLQTQHTFSHWYWNALPTVHGKPVTSG